MISPTESLTITAPTTEKHKNKLYQASKTIYLFLLAGNSITALDAVHRFGCTSLTARISELRRSGVPIENRFEFTKTGARIKRYWLSAEYIAKHKSNPNHLWENENDEV